MRLSFAGRSVTERAGRLGHRSALLYCGAISDRVGGSRNHEQEGRMEGHDAHVMTEDEQERHHERCMIVRSALSSLRLSGITDEDVQVAMARLGNWLTENDGRWVK